MFSNTRVLLNGLTDEEIKKKLNIYKFVGFHVIFVEYNFDFNFEFRAHLNKLQKLTTLKLVGKIAFHPVSIKDLKKKLQKVQNYKDFALSVVSNNKEILTFAANDSRIDIISFTNIENIKDLTPGLISLLKQFEKFFEISIIDILISHNNNRSRVFREIYKILKLVNHNTKILLFGGSERENFYIRGPREIISIFHSIFNLNLAQSKRIVRENPSELMNRLISRNNPDYLQTGVEIVNRFKKKDKECG